MSYIVHENKIMTLTDFCLSEAILPKETAFGTDKDMNDGKTKRIGDPVDRFHYTFFKGKKSHHIAGIHANGEVGIGTSDEHTLDPFKYDDSRRRTNDDARHFFGKAMHVIHHIADKHGINHLKFDASNPKLGSVYDMMSRSPSTVKSMKERGWSYKGKHDGMHHFERDH